MYKYLYISGFITMENVYTKFLILDLKFMLLKFIRYTMIHRNA